MLCLYTKEITENMPDKQDDVEPVLLTVSTTVCRKCAFAEYEGDEQTGCSAGRLDVFRKNGVEVLEAEDGERKFFSRLY